MTFVKKHWWKIILAALIILGVYRVAVFYKNKQKPVAQETNEKTVNIFALNENLGASIETLCRVEPQTDVFVKPELSAKVTKVHVKNGDTVKAGDTLVSLENIQQRISVQNANVSYTSAKLALSDLLNNNNQDAGSLLEQTKKSGELAVENAYNAYLNTDLRAYPEDYDEDSSAPIISGNYNCKQEGEYRIEVYGSAADSGASLRVSGLETGRASVTTDFSTKLLNCGLEITFPKDFKKDKEWIIPVPNTRSGSHFAAKTQFESAKNNKDLSVNQTGASAEEIAQARARVNQAALSLEAARDNLNKTKIVAPVDGTLGSFDVSVGDFISAQSDMAVIQSVDKLKLVAYVSADEKNRISENSLVNLGGEETTVYSVSNSIDKQTKKLKVEIVAPESLDLIADTEESCSITRSLTPGSEVKDGELIIPLSAVSVIGLDYYVFSVVDGLAQKNPIEVGAILGDSIAVYNLELESIIRDARGVRDGQAVIIKES